MENEIHTILIGQTTHQDSGKKSGLSCILFDKSCMRHILFHAKMWPAAHLLDYIWFQVFYSVYQSVDVVNDSNSNTEWLIRHNLYQKVMKKVLNNKLFVKLNLVRYKSQYTSGRLQSELALDWHGTSTGHNLFIFLKISGALLMFGVKTSQQPCPCQSPVALLWVLYYPSAVGL